MLHLNSGHWDARNHLTSLSGANAASFVYDGFGRRTSKSIGGATTQFLYDRRNPVQELDGGSPANVTANLLTGLGIDEFFQRTDAANGAMSLITDILGSALALSDSSGTIQTQYTYQPFGTATSSGNANANSYQFTGRENDGTDCTSTARATTAPPSNDSSRKTRLDSRAATLTCIATHETRRQSGAILLADGLGNTLLRRQVMIRALGDHPSNFLTVDGI